MATSSTDETPASLDSPHSITNAMARARFRGKASYDPKSEVLTIEYDFKNAKQLKDFRYQGFNSSLVKSALWLAPGQAIQHVAKFTTVKMTGQIMIRGLGSSVRTSTKVVIGNKGGLGAPGKWVEPKVPCKVNVFHPFEFVIGENRVGMRLSHIVSEIKMTIPDEYLEFHGGRAGNAFGYITISGKLDTDWAKEFFSQ